MSYTLSWEPFHFTDFTYTIALTVIPRLLAPTSVLTVEEWGFFVGNDETGVGFMRDGRQVPWAKTNRHPYTKDIMKALILLVEYGVTQGLNHSDADMTWYLDALEEVHIHHPLISYYQQKAYFIDLHARKRQAQPKNTSPPH